MNRKLQNKELKRLEVNQFKEATKNPLRIILEDVRSAGNVGSVFRSSDAFLIDKLYLCGISAQPPHREINKTALGATETVNWVYFEDSAAAIEECVADGYSVYAVEQAEKSILLHNFSPAGDEKIVLIFGNEVDGVKQNTINLCKGVIEIEQSGTKHSINISVCAGIVCWHLTQKTISSET